ncbi:hypothetical protein AAKU67_004386 [Oxalobacteraceae bacterium GrIS 2.11]
MNKFTHANSLPNRYRPSSIQGRIVVCCEYTVEDLLNDSMSVTLSKRCGSPIHAVNDQQHWVVITTTRNNHQIPIGRHSV